MHRHAYWQNTITAGASDSTAAVINEAVTDGATVTPLTDFVLTHSEEALTNQGFLAGAAQNINMSDPSGGSATAGWADGVMSPSMNGYGAEVTVDPEAGILHLPRRHRPST